MRPLSMKGLAKSVALLLTKAIVNAVPFSGGHNDTLAGLISPPSSTSPSGWNQTYFGNSTSTSASSSPKYSSTSQPALLPDVHWDQPTDDLQSLTPSNNQSLYYSSNGASNPVEEHTFAKVYTNTSHPSVVLAHSQYIKGVTCDANGLHIDCRDKASLAYIESTWSASLPLIVVTFIEGCGSSADQSVFWLVNHINTVSAVFSGSVSNYKSESNSGSGSNTIHAVIQQQLSIGEALPEIEIIWGTYSPNKNVAHSISSKPNSPYSLGRNSGFGNYAMGNGSNAACGAPPSRMIDGFYTAACGSPTFDQDIDREIGFFDFDTSNYSASLKNFAPGLEDDYSAADNEDFGPTEERRAAMKRRSFKESIDEFFRKLVKFLRDSILSAAKQVGEAISNSLPVEIPVSIDVPILLEPSGLVDSPFGKAKQIYSQRKAPKGGAGSRKIKQKASKNSAASENSTFYCVNRSVHGLVHLNGKARFTTAHGLNQANIGMIGNFAAGFQIGIDAVDEISNTLRYPIVPPAGLPGFSVSGVFAIGPMLSLDAEVELGITLAGQVLAGVRMTVTNFSANLDLVNSSKSFSEAFMPQFEKVFEAKSEITATAALGLRLGIELGIGIPPLKFEKTVGLYEKPSLGATIIYPGSTTSQAANSNNTCVNGIAHSLQFGNDVYADFFGAAKENLYSWKVPIVGACFPLGATPTAAVSTDQPGSDQTGTTTSPNIPATVRTDTVPIADQAAQRRAALEISRSIKEPLLKHQDNGTDGENDTDNSGDPYSFVDSDDQDETADNSEFEALSNEALAEADSELTGNDTGFVYINDATSTYGLEADPITGNIYVGDPEDVSLFASTQGIIVGDYSGRYFHYYPDLMNAYNVSRYRLADETQIPKEAQFVALIPVDYDNSTLTPDVYAAFETSGNTFLTITCDIQGELSKVFLARDAEEGIKALMDPHLRYTVTGGIVTSCYFLPFVAPPGSSDAISVS